MNESEKITAAIKWNSVSEIFAKLFVPITNILLARVLLPEEFGIVATIMMIITLIDLVSESGFQKYIIRTEFTNTSELKKYLNVAFTINLSVTSILIFIVIILRTKIGQILGNVDLIPPLLLAMVLLLLSGLISVQTALFKKQLNFKILGITRVISVLVPLGVTLPMAIAGSSYWSIIIGKICSDLLTLILLQLKSDWKPQILFSKTITNKMIKTSIWALFETILMWFTTYIGVFYLTLYSSTYFVGMYRTSMVSVDGILVTIYMPLISVMYSAMASKNNIIDKVYMFEKFHKVIALLLIPSSIGIFLYKDFVALILLGSNWKEAPLFIGMWALSTMLYVLLGTSFYELYRAKGNFKQPVILHCMYSLVYVSILFVVRPSSFTSFVFLNTIIRASVLPTMNLIMYWIDSKESLWEMCKNECTFALSTIVMYIFTHIYFENRISNNITENLFQITLNGLLYIMIILIFKKNRDEIKIFFNNRIQ